MPSFALLNQNKPGHRLTNDESAEGPRVPKRLQYNNSANLWGYLLCKLVWDVGQDRFLFRKFKTLGLQSLLFAMIFKVSKLRGLSTRIKINVQLSEDLFTKGLKVVEKG